MPEGLPQCKHHPTAPTGSTLQLRPDPTVPPAQPSEHKGGTREGLNGDTLFRFELPSEKLNRFVLHNPQETISNTVFKQHPDVLLLLPIQPLSPLNAEANCSAAAAAHRAVRAKENAWGVDGWSQNTTVLLSNWSISCTLIKVRIF